MTAAFTIISATVLIVSVYFLVQHAKLMQRRGKVDDALILMEETLDEGRDELQAAIKTYNEAVNIYNAYIDNYPGKVSAALVGLTKEKEMEMPE